MTDVMLPQITTVVPTHNVELWVAEAIRSVLVQEGVDVRVIAVDDHSTDGTVDVLEGIAAVDPRVTGLRSTASGGGEARNIGVARVTTEFLAFADGDDVVPPGTYARFAEVLRESGSDLVIGDYITFAPASSWRRTNGLPIYGEARRGITLGTEPRLLRDRVVWNKLFRTSSWRRDGVTFTNPPRANDIVAMTRALSRATIDIEPMVSYVYRRRPGGSSMTSRARSVEALRSYFEQELLCHEELVAHGEHNALNHHLIQTIDVDGGQALKGFTGGTISAPLLLEDEDAKSVGALVDQILVAAEPILARTDEVSARVLHLVAAGRGDLVPWADVNGLAPEDVSTLDIEGIFEARRILRMRGAATEDLLSFWRGSILPRFERAWSVRDDDGTSHAAEILVRIQDAMLDTSRLTGHERMVLSLIRAGLLDEAGSLAHVKRRATASRGAADGARNRLVFRYTGRQDLDVSPLALLVREPGVGVQGSSRLELTMVEQRSNSILELDVQGRWPSSAHALLEIAVAGAGTVLLPVKA